MRKIITIIREEYRRRVLRKEFIGLLLLPLIIIAVGAVIGYITTSSLDGENLGVVGIVDPQGVLAGAVDARTDDGVMFVQVKSVEEGRAALMREELRALYVLRPSFADDGAVDAHYRSKPPGNDIERAFGAYARTMLLSGFEPAVRARLEEGAVFTYQTPDRSRTFARDDIITFVLPIMIGVVLIVSLMVGAQYLMQAVIDEKENRTIEVLITSVTPRQLMAGKILGLTAVTLTQIVTWALGATAALLVLRERIPVIGAIRLDASFLAAIGSLFVLQFLMYAAIMVAIGSAVADAKQGQAISTPITLLAIAPELFLPALFIDPNGVIAVILTLFPFTSPFTLAFRYSMTTVPGWQMIVAVALMAVAALLAIVAAGRLFRVGLLRFGQKAPLSELFDALRI